MNRVLSASLLAAGLVLPLPAVLVGYDAVHAAHSHTATNPATLALCSDRTDIVSVWRDDPTPCDVHAPQRLDVYGLTLAECDDAGGEYILTNPADETVPATYICEGVDH